MFEWISQDREDADQAFEEMYGVDPNKDESIRVEVARVGERDGAFLEGNGELE